MSKSSPELEAPPVIVLQGFMLHDILTMFLRQEIRNHGYSDNSSGTGFNIGLTQDMYNQQQRHFDSVYEEHDGQPISIVGHSLGGAQAHLLGYRNPGRVNSIITMGTPFQGMFGENGSNITFGFTGSKDRDLYEELKERISEGPPEGVVARSLYSPIFDELVTGKSGQNPWEDHINAENVRIDDHHMVNHNGFLVHPHIVQRIRNHLDELAGRFPELSALPNSPVFS